MDRGKCWEADSKVRTLVQYCAKGLAMKFKITNETKWAEIVQLQAYQIEKR